VLDISCRVASQATSATPNPPIRTQKLYNAIKVLKNPRGHTTCSNPVLLNLFSFTEHSTRRQNFAEHLNHYLHDLFWVICACFNEHNRCTSG